MWTHYADENRGCCIEVKVTSKKWHKVDVDYSQQLPTVEQGMNVEDILGVKAKMWEYEQETRFLKECSGNTRPMLFVKICRIFIGCKVDTSQFYFLRKLIRSIDNQIEVIKMKRDWLDYGFQSLN